MSPRPFVCETCQAVVVRDGDLEVYQGTALIHVPATCGKVRQRIQVPIWIRRARRGTPR